jgi:NAD(P)-dependent dehydrogenase (short-subunit alcohol dehydrogenase family)
MIEDFQGTRAVVTGAASGIGRGLAHALLEAGARVVSADYDGEGLEMEKRRAGERGFDLETIRVDVSTPDELDRVKALADERMGGTDLLVNNAGVAFNSVPLWETPHAMVEWSYGVNVYGVINGIRAFVPDMIAQGSGYIVNTASIGGFQVRKSSMWFQGLYASTKYAVVALSEALAQDVEEHGIGVSILAPASVNTGIGDSERVMLDRFAGTEIAPGTDQMREMLRSGLSPDTVASIVLDAVRHGTRYIFTEPADRDLVERRHAGILAGFDRAQQVRDEIEATPGR